MANPFLNRAERRPRAAWRLLGQGLLFLVLLAVLGALVSLVAPLPETAGPDALLELDAVAVAPQFLAAAVAALLSVWVAARWLDRRPLADLGLQLDASWWRDLGFGLVLGAVLMLGVFAVQVLAGWLVVEGVALDRATLGRFLLAGVAPFVAVGVYEEVLSRGYQLTNVAEGLRGWLGPRGAVVAGWVVSSLLFGALHGINPGATAVSTAIIVLAGLFLGLGFVLTGRLGVPIGLHITWNLVMGPVLGMPVSGVDPGATALVRTEAVGPQLVTGGAFGPEGGLSGLGAILVGSAVIVWWVRRTEGRSALHEPIAAAPRRPQPGAEGGPAS